MSMNANSNVVSGDAKKLLKLLGDSVTTLLVIMLHFVRKAKKGDHSPDEHGAEIRRNLKAALDHSRLDVSVSLRYNNVVGVQYC